MEILQKRNDDLSDRDDEVTREMKGATKMEINPEETEAAVERQELFKEELNVDIIASSEDR
jgi:hypothetical protein